jgi:hypothetical protein
VRFQVIECEACFTFEVLIEHRSHLAAWHRDCAHTYFAAELPEVNLLPIGSGLVSLVVRRLIPPANIRIWRLR